MEQDQFQPQVGVNIQAVPPGPHILKEESRPDYFTRLFSGRLNRQNYIVGSTILVLVPMICFTVVIFNILHALDFFAMPTLDLNNLSNPSLIVAPTVSITSLLESPINKFWSATGILFIILSLPYLLSLQIKRLHDLNLNGFLWIITILPIFFTNSMLPLNKLFDPNALLLFFVNELYHPDIWFIIANIVSFVSGIFSIYITVWPGSKEANRYGNPPLPRSSFLEDIMMFK